MYILSVQYTKMETTTYTNFRKNLSSLLDRVEKDRTHIQITRRSHKKMILMVEEDFNSLNETLYLLSNNVNAKKLQESIDQGKKGLFVEVDLDAY